MALWGLAVLVLQGCITGITGPEILSGHDAIDAEELGPVPVLVGTRLGLVNGQVSSYTERFLTETLIAKLLEGRVFQTLNYPLTGNENVVLEIGGTGAFSPGAGADSFSFKNLLCGVTLLLVCLPYTREYEFQLEIRAVSWPEGKAINRYQSTGKTRVEYRMQSEAQAKADAKNLAITAAYNEVINQIKHDRERYRGDFDRSGTPL
jgi:hypothetical protein